MPDRPPLSFGYRLRRIVHPNRTAPGAHVFTSGAAEMNVHETHTNHSGLTTRSLLAPAANKSGSSYLADIRRFSLLEREQEYRLAKRWREHGDRKAADQIVTSHLRLAAKIATNYRGYGLPISDIISEGNVGLMQAVNRFEPERGFRFATYAVWWIRASIQDYILRSWSLVKLGTTKNQKKLFFKLDAAKRKISALDGGRDLRPDQVTLIANSLDVTDREVIDMDRRILGDTSLNAQIRDEDDAEEWQNCLVDQSPSPEAIVAEQDERHYQHKALACAIEVLTGRERRIFEARHLADEPTTLEDLAVEFNVSCERVRRIEVRAFEKVRKAARKHAAKIRAPAARSA